MACAFARDIAGAMLMLALNCFAAMLETLFEQQLDTPGQRRAATPAGQSRITAKAAGPIAVFLASTVE